MKQIIQMAYRDLIRNKRRSLLSALALGMGLSLLLFMAAVVQGEMRDSMESTIRLQSGHLQISAVDYNPDKNSLAWKDLIENPDEIASKIASQPEVTVATPRLLASGIINTADESIGVQIIGIDPTSSANTPYSNGMISGEFIKSDDRDGLLVGKDLAAKYKLKTGDTIQLLANTASGDVIEQNFTIRGIFSTKIPAFDQTTILLPLLKAQAMTGTEKYSSIIFVLLKSRDLADTVKDRLHSEQYTIKTWVQMNQLMTSYENLADSYMYLLYLIVLCVTATVIVNTLVMSVFERTREIGIISAVGMRSSSIMNMFLIESFMLAITGIVMGLVLGSLLVLYSERVGFYIGNFGLTGIMLGERIYGYMTVQDAIPLVIISLVVTLLASLYPAIMAARMEPIDALHGGKLA